MTTYDMFNAEEVVEAYKPFKYQLISYVNSAEITTYIKSMEMLLDQDVDFIVATRFDILFRSTVIDWDIKYEKFNVTFKDSNAFIWFLSFLQKIKSFFNLPWILVTC